MKFQISNFTCAHQLEIESHSSHYTDDYGGCGVRITQSSGSMHFQHDMTVEQALKMAEALIACSATATAEKMQKEAA